MNGLSIDENAFTLMVRRDIIAELAVLIDSRLHSQSHTPCQILFCGFEERREKEWLCRDTQAVGKGSRSFKNGNRFTCIINLTVLSGQTFIQIRQAIKTLLVNGRQSLAMPNVTSPGTTAPKGFFLWFTSLFFLSGWGTYTFFERT